MQFVKFLGASVLGATVLVGSTPAQEKPKPKAQRIVRAIALTGPGRQAPKTQEQLKESFEQKLAGNWVKNAAWITDYDQARAQSKESGRKIFAYFTRSYSP